MSELGFALPWLFWLAVLWAVVGFGLGCLLGFIVQTMRGSP